MTRIFTTTRNRTPWFVITLVFSLFCLTGVVRAEVSSHEPETIEFASELTESIFEQDRLFLVSTRHLPSNLCNAIADDIPFRIMSCEQGYWNHLELGQYESELDAIRPVVVYVHGNQMPADELMKRACAVKRYIRAFRSPAGVDWVVFSWPSQREAFGLRDARIKADRCDANAIYLAWFLKRHVAREIPLGMVAYSFGCRVATGALHVLAGGLMHGRGLAEPPVTGARVRVGLVAPAIESHWLANCGYHSQATKNMDRLLLLYNRRDAVLKRYWLIDKVRQQTALGYSGPTSFAPRVDGSRLPVVSKDFAPSVKFHHSELDFYEKSRNAGYQMAALINGIQRPVETSETEQ